MEAGMHAFESAGLGKAPFRFVGMEAQDLCYGEAILNRAEYERTGIRVTTAPGGSCAFCGNYIVQMFNIVSADGRRFHVGSECVNKTGDEGLRKVVNKALAARRREKNAARARAQEAELTALLADESVRAKLAGKPHHNAHMAAKGLSKLDSCVWMMANAGAAGIARTLKMVKECVKSGELEGGAE